MCMLTEKERTCQRQVLAVMRWASWAPRLATDGCGMPADSFWTEMCATQAGHVYFKGRYDHPDPRNYRRYADSRTQDPHMAL